MASLNQLCMVDEKILSQISKTEYIEIKSAWKEANTSRFLEMELWRLKVHVQRGILCTAHAHRVFSIFDRLFLMTHVSSGEGKGAIFLTFDSSFVLCGQFCPGRTFYFDDSYFKGKP